MDSSMSNNIRNYFDSSVDFFDQAYQDVRRRYHLIRRKDTMLEELTLLDRRQDSGPWLDAACGAGLLACEMAARGYKVFGIDFAPNMISRASANAARLGLSERTSFQVGNLAELPYE